jgi:hypothetical protein
MAKHPMADIASLDNAASWVNMLYIALVTLTLLATVVIVVLSHQRLTAKEEELKRVRAEMQQRVAAANQRYTEAFERASKSDAALTKAQSDIAAAILAQAQLRKQNIQLSTELEREKQLRLEVEERVVRQPLLSANGNGRTHGLTTEQEESLLVEMRRFPEKRVTIIELADPAAGAMARQITTTLEKAQWNIVVNRVGALTPSQQGIICTHGPGDSAASAFVLALRSFNFIVYERTDSVDQFQIIVALNPAA